MKKILIAYMPVLHQGYIDWINKHKDATSLRIFDQTLINQFDWLKRKDIRAVNPSMMCRALSGLALIPNVGLLWSKAIEEYQHEDYSLVFADEEESHQVAEKFFPTSNVTFDKVFLRWNKKTILDESAIEAFTVSTEELDQRFMLEAKRVAEKSSDWWIRVGAILVNGSKSITAYNKHVPSEYTPYVLGDPRSFFQKGVEFTLSTALHAEGGIIVRALKEGVSTNGAKLYVTTFPCPLCANFLSQSGISELYFQDGYSLLEGAKLLEDAGIKIFRVQKKNPLD